MAKRVSVQMLDEMAFWAETGSGHGLTLDADEDVGGRNRGARPIEMMLLGVAGCTAMDVVSILRKMRQDLVEYTVDVEGDQVAEHPRVFDQITVRHRVRGRGLDAAQVRRAISLSAERYCPAIATMRRTATIRLIASVTDLATGETQEAVL